MTDKNKAVLDRLQGGLVVSCQALPNEPLHSSYIMSRMAYAAFLGGAVGIRANTVADITEIRKTVDLPIIGIIKEVYPDHPDVYITPTMTEVDALVECGVEIIALDATRRVRPGGRSLADFFGEVRAKYPEQLFMADCADFQDGMAAAAMGFDLIGTTMASYT
ncbi:MAG: N-acetylmannosamine-6-phosphate 2-epimerase, partial [Pygmaiobacter massiliensis]